MATASAPKPPLWRNVRVLRILWQIAFVVLMIVALQQIWLNLTFNLNEQQSPDVVADIRRCTASLFGADEDCFLQARAGFDIKEGIDYSPNESFGKAFLVGVFNTIFVSGTGIVLATLVGLMVGVGRLSPNWIARRLTQLYVDVFRNIPLLVQLFIWYVAVFLALPLLENGVALFDSLFLSQRGAALPWIRGDDGFGSWGLFLLVGVVVAAGVWRWRTRVNEETGKPSYRVVLAFATVFLAALLGYLITSPFHVETPQVTRFDYEGGIQMSPEFAALLVGLTLYTAAFIAEIVRGSILAVSRGQKEAAEALGFTPGQQLRLVVLPQALRVALPPTTSQYLNLIKNSSLGFAIGYPEIISVQSTITNQAGRTFQVVVLVSVTYLTINLIVSIVMNTFNRLVALRGERR